MDLKKKLYGRKIFRRFTLVGAISQITLVVWYVLLYTPEIATGTATLVSAMIGVLSGVIGFYQWSRKEDDNIIEKMKILSNRWPSVDDSSDGMVPEERNREGRRLNPAANNNPRSTRDNSRES